MKLLQPGKGESPIRAGVWERVFALHKESSPKGNRTPVTGVRVRKHGVPVEPQPTQHKGVRRFCQMFDMAFCPFFSTAALGPVLGAVFFSLDFVPGLSRRRRGFESR